MNCVMHVLLLHNYIHSQRFQHYADVLTKELHASRRWFGGWDIGRRLPFVFFVYIAVLPSLALVGYNYVLGVNWIAHAAWGHNKRDNLETCISYLPV